MDLPDFVPYAPPPQSDPEFPPPYRFEQVLARVFPIVAPYQRAMDVCDRFINDIARRDHFPFRIEPLPLLLGPPDRALVRISIVTYGRLMSATYPELGFSKQNELLFDIPIRLSEGVESPKCGVFVPYVFVNNDWSLISGRDVLGYPKLRGHFSPDSLPTRVDVRAMREYGQDSEAKPMLLLDVAGSMSREAGTASDQTAWPFGPVGQMFGRDSPYPLDEDLLNLMQKCAGSTTWNVALKQFRDAEQPDKACYQALVDSNLVLTKFYGHRWFPPATLRLHTYESLDLGKIFGIGGELQSDQPYSLSYDVLLKDVRNLHVTYGAESGAKGESPTG